MDAVFWMDADSRFIYVNDEACRSLGYSRDEFCSMHLWDIDHEFTQGMWLESLEISGNKFVLDTGSWPIGVNHINGYYWMALGFPECSGPKGCEAHILAKYPDTNVTVTP